MSGLVNASGTEQVINEALQWGASRYGQSASLAGGLMKMASRYVRSYIVGLALGHVMQQRKGPACADRDLAYADHYLQARLMVGYLGPCGYHLTHALVDGYEVTKKIAQELGLLDKLASDANCPQPVPPDLTSMAWGHRGAEDGLADYLILAAEGMQQVWKRSFPAHAGKRP